jgi:hypothetical protein
VRRTFFTAAVGASLTALFYAVGSFAAWDINPAHWPAGARFGLAFAWAGVVVLTMLALIASAEEA